MSILLNRVAVALLITGALSSHAFAAPAEPAPDKTPPAKAAAPDAKAPTARERLTKESQEAYQRLKELRETLAQLDVALATSDTDKAWEHSAQLKILWETLSSRQRISMERRYPGTRTRVEKAIAEGKALARTAAPKEPVARAKEKEKEKEEAKADPEVALAKKTEDEKKVDETPAPKKE